VTVNVHLGDEQGLDRSRRYLRPVSVTTISGEPDGVHLSVYEWLPRFDAWATGLALCGASADQGALPEGTVVTCHGCEAYRPKYERYLAPGYRREDDDPEALRARIAKARAIHQPVAGEGDTQWCQVCAQEERQPQPVGWWVPFPCPTVQALEGTGT